MPNTDAAARLEIAAKDRAKVEGAIEQIERKAAELEAEATADNEARAGLAIEAVLNAGSEAERRLQDLTGRAGQRASMGEALHEARGQAEAMLAAIDQRVATLKHLADAELALTKTPEQRLALEKAEAAADMLATALEVWRTEVGVSRLQHESYRQKGLMRTGLMHLMAGGLGAVLAKFDVSVPMVASGHQCTLVQLFDDLVGHERAARLAHLRAKADNADALRSCPIAEAGCSVAREGLNHHGVVQ